jgi:hypothetical protein
MSGSTQQESQSLPTRPTQPFRPDGPLHDLLEKPAESSPLAGAEHAPRTSLVLPSPAFPQHPALLHEIDSADVAAHEADRQTGTRHWPTSNITMPMCGWMFPDFKSRVLPGELQPLIANPSTEWKYNLDSHYYCSDDNRITGLTEDAARRAIDWLHAMPFRMLAPTGGESLLRSDFVHKVIDYAAKCDFWVYLGTNVRLLRLKVTDRLSDAGIATVKFAKKYTSASLC